MKLTEELWYGIAHYTAEYPELPMQSKSNNLPWGLLQKWMNIKSGIEKCVSIEVIRVREERRL